jgi:hypothetical protein
MPHYLVPISAILEIEAAAEAVALAWAEALPRSITLNGVIVDLVVMFPVRFRKCRFCGCTDDNACRLSDVPTNLGDGEPCAWIDGVQDVCTNPSCLEKLEVEGRKVEVPA